MAGPLGTVCDAAESTRATARCSVKGHDEVGGELKREVARFVVRHRYAAAREMMGSMPDGKSGHRNATKMPPTIEKK